jgi:hypothetical protein
MALNGRSIVLQLDRLAVLGRIQEFASLRGQAMSPPFQLSTPAGKPGVVAHPLPSVAIIVKAVDLQLTVGTNEGHLLLEIEDGMLRVGGANLRIRSGVLDIKVVFVNRTTLAVRPKEATFTNLNADGAAAVANFAALANVEAGHLLDIDRDHDFEVLPDVDTVNPLRGVAAFFGSENICVDGETLEILFGGTPGTTVPRLITGINNVALAQSEAIVKSNLLEPALRDQLLDKNDPNADLPPPWGSGKIPKDQDGAHIDITELNLDFADGYINVSGTFDAHDDCWDVAGGHYQQKLYLDMVAGNPAKLLPRMDPASPNVQYDVNVHFLCSLVEFAAGAIIGMTAGGIYGIGAIVAVEVIKGSVNPAIPATDLTAVSLFAPMSGTWWKSIQITVEGAIVQGNLPISPLPHPVPPGVRLHVEDAMRMTGGTIGQVASGPPCEPKLFDYEEVGQAHDFTYEVTTVGLIEPIAVTWTINGTLLTQRSGTYKYTGTVNAALPPPNGTDIPNHEVEVAYEIGGALLLDSSARNLALHTRDGDLNYTMRIEVRAADAIDRAYYDAVNTSVVGDRVFMGPDYDAYIAECLAKIRDTADKKGRQQVHPKPGQPQEKLGDIVARVIEHIQAGNAESHVLLSAAVRAYGAPAVGAELTSQARQIASRGSI